MLTVEEAQARILAAVAPLEAELVLLDRARGRILAAEIVAGRALPPWDNSAMDGYAVRRADVAGAGPGAPVELPVAGLIAAGRPAGRPLRPGEAFQIMTGAPLPEGADAVVPREEAAAADGRVRVLRAPGAAAWIRRAGEDVAGGEVALPAGAALGPGELGLLAALGRTVVAVRRRPRVAILSTGDELVEADQAPGPGQIVNSNGHALAALVEEAGGTPLRLPTAPDDAPALRRLIEDGLGADALLTSGGVSVGELDLVRGALEACGVTLAFWQVAMKPGKPVAFGARAGRPAFGLPGNPASSMVAFELFVRPALARLGGDLRAQERPRAPVVVATPTPYRKEIGRRHYLRAAVAREGATLRATPLGRQGSGMLRSMIGVDALLEVAEASTGFTDGDRLDALLLRAV